MVIDLKITQDTIRFVSKGYGEIEHNQTIRYDTTLFFVRIVRSLNLAICK